MSESFARAHLPPPSKKSILSIVGLSLDRAVATLAPNVPTALQDQMVTWYKDAYIELRARVGA
ncbi:MAG: HAD family hydrolase, partial [Pseudomonadota bacterium]